MEKVEKYYSALHSSDKVLRRYAKLRHSTTEYCTVLQRYDSIVVCLKLGSWLTCPLTFCSMSLLCYHLFYGIYLFMKKVGRREYRLNISPQAEAWESHELLSKPLRSY